MKNSPKKPKAVMANPVGPIIPLNETTPRLSPKKPKALMVHAQLAESTAGSGDRTAAAAAGVGQVLLAQDSVQVQVHSQS